MQSYDYTRREGIREISWEDFAALAARLAEGLSSHNIEVVIGIARAGLFPATSVACILRRELYPVRVTRRMNDEVTYDSPVWRVGVSPEVSGKIVAVVDEIADTGETLRLVANEVLRQGARCVVTGTLTSHTWASPSPTVCPLISDALIVFPWDRLVFADGKWQAHPELVEALRLQSGNEGS